jgi:hypothetical protein
MLHQDGPDFLLKEGGACRIGSEEGRSEEYPISNKE